MNLDQLISVFEGVSHGGRAAKPGGLGCDILTAMKPFRKTDSLFKEEQKVWFSAISNRLGCPGHLS